MSRTYRKPRWVVEETDETYIDRQLNLERRFPTVWQRVRKTKEEYEADYAKAKAEFDEDIRKNGPYAHRWILDLASYNAKIGFTRTYTQYEKHFFPPSKYKRIKIDPPSDEDTIAKAKAWRSKLTWDGTCTETTRRSGFKKDAAHEVRRSNKRFCDKIVRDDDWEDDPYPIRKEGSHYKWSWW